MARRTNLRNIDLNLLPILDILLDEKSVTLASKRVFLSQSATSSALHRLRETFNDPVLIRQGQKMVASPKAQLIHEELKNALYALDDIVTQLQSDEDADQNRLISIASPEYVAMTLSHVLREILVIQSPSYSVNFTPFVRKSVIEALEKGQADLALGAFGSLGSAFKREVLYEEDIVVVMRHGHPALQAGDNARITTDDFSAYPHVVVSADGILEDAWISKTASAKSIDMEASVVVPSIGLVADVLKSTDLLCVGTERTLKNLASDADGLTYLKPPESLEIDQYDIELIWHERHDADEPLASIRDLIISASRKLDEPAAMIANQ